MTPNDPAPAGEDERDPVPKADGKDARRRVAKSVTENPNNARQNALWMGGGAVVVVVLALMLFMKPSAPKPPSSSSDAPKITERQDEPKPLASDPPAGAVSEATAVAASAASDIYAQQAAQLAERQRELEQREAQLRAAQQAMVDARRKSDVFSEEPKSSGDDDGDAVPPAKRRSTPAISEGARLDDVRDDGSTARGRPGSDANSSFAREVEAEGLTVRRVGRMTRLECKILPGRILEGELQPRVVSDLPGLITIMLTRDTYGEKGRIPLMPWGTRITGRPNPVVRAGQERNFITSATAFLPDGQYVQIDSGVADQLGSAGLDSEVDRHFGQILGMSAVLSLLGAGASNIGVSQSGQYNSGSQYRSNVQSSLAQSAQQQLNGYANIPPTLKNEQGTKVRIMVEKVLDFGDRCATGREG